MLVGAHAQKLRWVAWAAMANRIVVFGATGYTGRLIAERLVAAGARPVLAGRSGDRLSSLAASLGGLPWERADAMRQNTVLDLVGPGDVLISTVGPFAKWGVPAVRAACDAGCVYMDTTGEPVHIRRVFEEFSGAAARSGAALLPAMGYDFAPGVLAGALAVGGHPRVDRGRDPGRLARVPRRHGAARATGRAGALVPGRGPFARGDLRGRVRALRVAGRVRRLA